MLDTRVRFEVLDSFRGIAAICVAMTHMLFNLYDFIFVFLPITFFIYFYLNHKRLTEVSKGGNFAIP
jgi:peptidoglycan/LPS O-acetylase OafA/YrhL